MRYPIPGLPGAAGPRSACSCVGRLVSSILYRLRAEIRRQWFSWLGIVLLIGVVAGPVLGLIAGARRTSTVYDRFLAETEPADVLIAESPDFGITKIDLQAAADLPEVEQAAISAVYFTVIRLEDDRLILPGNDAIVMVDPAVRWATVSISRAAIRGRLADPADPTEVVVGFSLARRFGLEVGDTLEISLIQLESLPAAQLEFLATIEHRVATPAAEIFDWESFVTGARVDVEVVGVTAAPLEFPPLGAIIPIVRVHTGVRTGGGRRKLGHAVPPRGAVPGVSVADYQQQVEEVAAAGSAVAVLLVGTLQAESVEQGFAVRSLSLAALGAIFGLSGLIIIVQASARLVAANAGPARILMAIGMGRRSLVSLAMLRMAVIAAVGAAIAVVVAVALSPLWPPVMPASPRSTRSRARTRSRWSVVSSSSCSSYPFAGWQASVEHRRPGSPTRRRPPFSAAGPPPIRLGVGFALTSRAPGGMVPVRSSRVATVTAPLLVAFILVVQDQSARLSRHRPRTGGAGDAAGVGRTTQLRRVRHRGPLRRGRHHRYGRGNHHQSRCGRAAHRYPRRRRCERIDRADASGRVGPERSGSDRVGSLALDAIERSVGDTVTVTVGDHSEEFLVVGEVVTPTLGDQGRLGWGGFVRATALRELVPGLASNVVLVDLRPGAGSEVRENIRQAVAPIGTRDSRNGDEPVSPMPRRPACSCSSHS